VTSARTPPRTLAQRPLLVLLVDVVLVLVFAATGRASHAEEHPVLGVLLTAWPFLAGLLIGWLASRNWRTPLRLMPNGVLLWIITVVAGMSLRILSGRTAELPFVLVATVVLGLFLLGFRVIAGRLATVRQRGARPGAE
jgi:peptidoglycan/LPS O-acetylase OafA/YrhL